MTNYLASLKEASLAPNAVPAVDVTQLGPSVKGAVSLADSPGGIAVCDEGSQS